MSIPLEPTRPVEGVASPPPHKAYIPRALGPPRFWQLIKMGAMLNRVRGLSGALVASFLVPPGFPGSGVIRGRQNINKSLTYRATYVPGGFNVERDKRRAAWKVLDAIALE